MENKAFKKIVERVLVLNQFKKIKSSYYKQNDCCTFIIGLQKSNYSNLYYIELGIIITPLEKELGSLSFANSEIRSRFTIIDGKKETDAFDLDILTDQDKEMISSAIQKNIDLYVSPVNSLETVRTMLTREPQLLYQTTWKAKELLNL